MVLGEVNYVFEDGGSEVRSGGGRYTIVTNDVGELEFQHVKIITVSRRPMYT